MEKERARGGVGERARGREGERRLEKTIILSYLHNEIGYAKEYNYNFGYNIEFRSIRGPNR
jgi:hypothetical protein